MTRGIKIAVSTLACLALAGAVAHASSEPGWTRAPVVPTIGPKDRALLQSRIRFGEKLGLRPGVFAKIGDSNTELAQNLYGLGCRTPKGLPAGLRRTLRLYKRVRLPNPRGLPGCAPSNSFSRHSSAAQVGVFSTWPVYDIEALPDVGYTRKPAGCPLDTTPLDCELDAVRPRYASVLLGTNDLGMDIVLGAPGGAQATERMTRVIKALLARGVVPVLSTIPPVVTQLPEYQTRMDAGVDRTNGAIWRLSRRWRLPMINLWRAMEEPTMVNHGLIDDGLHLNFAGPGGMEFERDPDPRVFAQSVDFTREGLRHGANRRNLIWLKTLARLDAAAR